MAIMPARTGPTTTGAEAMARRAVASIWHRAWCERPDNCSLPDDLDSDDFAAADSMIDDLAGYGFKVAPHEATR